MAHGDSLVQELKNLAAAIAYDIKDLMSSVTLIYNGLTETNQNIQDNYVSVNGVQTLTNKTLNGSSFNGQVKQGISIYNMSSTTTINFFSNPIHVTTMVGNANCTLNCPVGRFTLIIKQDATGNRILTLTNSNIKYVAATAFQAPNTAANSITIYTILNDGTNLYVSSGKIGVA